jgi:transcriptional regulator with XRE-family HTH domain
MKTNPASTPDSASDTAWKFLARVARARREFIGLSQEELVTYGGPGKSTVSKIERAAQQSYPSRTQQQLEKALGWDRGTFAEILRHADSTYFEEFGESVLVDYVEAPMPDLTVGTEARTSASHLSDDELLAELTFRMKRYALEKEGKAHGQPPAKKTVESGGIPEEDAIEGEGDH